MTPHSPTHGSAPAPVNNTTVASMPLVRPQPSIVNLPNFESTSNPAEQQYCRQYIPSVSVIAPTSDDALSTPGAVSASLVSIQHRHMIRGSFKIVDHAGSWVPPVSLYHLAYPAYTDLDILFEGAPSTPSICKMKDVWQQQQHQLRCLEWNEQLLEYPGEPARNAEAAISYTLGVEEPSSCVQCSRRENSFPSCVYFRDAFGDTCAGCWYNGVHCTSRSPLSDLTDSFPNFKNPRIRTIRLPTLHHYGNPIELRVYPNYRVLTPGDIRNVMAVSLVYSNYIHGDNEMLVGNGGDSTRKRGNETTEDSIALKRRKE